MTTIARTPRSISARRRARRRRDEGAVMLVVMLILMIATASAAISVQSSASELHAAGQERIGLQAKYASEAAMMTTIAWIDMIGNSSQLLEVWQFWQRQLLPPPMLPDIAEPAISPTARHHAMRTTMQQQLQLPRANEIPPLSVASSGSGGAAAPAGTFVDTVGSFGPRQAYVPQAEGYVVDVNDCVEAPSGATPGAPAGGGPGGGQKIRQFYCVLTAHVRIELPGANSGFIDRWNFGAVPYERDRFRNDHDSRATILTPMMPANGQ